MAVSPGIVAAASAGFRNAKNGPANINPSAAGMLLSLRDSLTNLAPTLSPALTLITTDTAPPIATMYGTEKALYFNGASTTGLRYQYNANMHISGTWSMSIDFMSTKNGTNDGSYIFTIGEGFNYGWPEISLIQDKNNNYSFYMSTSNARDDIAQTIGTFPNNTWVRLGFYFFLNGGVAYNMSTYVNGQPKSTYYIGGSLPYNSQTGSNSAIQNAGMAVGGDKARYATRQWTGYIKNLYIGKLNFWA